MKIDAGIPKVPRWTKLPNEAAEFSDWKIQLQSPNTDDNKVEEIAVYSVHRAFLSWNSDYFKNLFVGDRFSESLENQSTIDLPYVITSEHFEQLLDFFYTGELELNSFNAIAVAYFGDYFGISSLKTEVISFLNKLDSSGGELVAYYEVAESLHMEDIEKTLAKKCAAIPSILSKNESELSKINNVVRFCRLICSERMNFQAHPEEDKDEKECWSVHLAAFIDTYSNHMDKDDFHFLTQIGILPVVSHSVAAKLIHQEQLFGLNEYEYNGGDGDSSYNTDDDSAYRRDCCCDDENSGCYGADDVCFMSDGSDTDSCDDDDGADLDLFLMNQQCDFGLSADEMCYYGLTSLQRRCTDAFIERLTNPDDTLESKMKEGDTLKKLPPDVLASLLLRMTAKLHKKQVSRSISV